MKTILYPKREEWAGIVERPHLDVSQLTATVRGVLDDVKSRGDEAVKEYELKFDHARLSSLAVSEAEMDEAERLVDDDLKSAIRLAHDNIRTFHESERFVGSKVSTQPGVTCWQKSVAIDKVGLYIPGGTAPLFSTVLMLATPAKIADLAVSKFTSIEPDMTILEPSAGRGALVEAVHRRCPSAVVDCYELMPENVTFLEKVEGAHIIGTDFTKAEGKWQRIIANPPFSGNQDIDHVYMMYDHLQIGGEMSVITSQHWKFAQDNKCQYFRQWLQDNNADITDIDSGEFKESNTSVATSLIHIVRKLKVGEQMSLF